MIKSSPIMTRIDVYFGGNIRAEFLKSYSEHVNLFGNLREAVENACRHKFLDDRDFLLKTNSNIIYNPFHCSEDHDFDFIIKDGLAECVVHEINSLKGYCAKIHQD